MKSTNITPRHSKQYMQHAINLAKKGLYTTNPNPRVGCVIVNNGKIVGQGYHKKTGQAHAEVYALQQAKALAKNADVYVTLEPCSHFGKTPPCANALINAKVKRVFIATLDPNPLVAGQGAQRLRDAGIIVYIGLLKQQSITLNIGFIKRMQTGLPWVRLKMASSLDGRTAMASGESKWITGEQARLDGHQLRARSSAILTGIGTVLADNPSLTVRLASQSKIAKPTIVVLDSKGLVTPQHKLVGENERVVIFTKNKRLKDVFKAINKVEIIVDDDKNKRINLLNVLHYLAQQEVNELYLECGATLAGAFIKQGLVDELVLYMAPKLLGSTAKPMFEIGIDTMLKSINFQFDAVKQLGKDIKITTYLNN